MVQMQLIARKERSRSGLPLKRFSISLLVVLGVGLCAAAFAADIPTPTPAVVNLLPASGDVKGWDVYPNTLVFAAGDKLTEIYDGGYQLYTKNGVVEAAQQMYRRKNDTATVTTHRMDSMIDAKKFFRYWQAVDKKQPTFKKLTVLSESYVYTSNGVANGYLFRGNYFVTVQVNVDGAAGRSIAEDLLKAVSGKYMKLAGH